MSFRCSQHSTNSCHHLVTAEVSEGGELQRALAPLMVMLNGFGENLILMADAWRVEAGTGTDAFLQGDIAKEVRTAALETLAENLSDGVIAPLFWYALLGVPGMLAYKMVNTLDSMIGYKTDRYKDFGCWAAHIDDIANYIPARLTALLMVVVAGKPQLASFVWRNGRRHASPNSGYPEAALAGILNCRFGGPHYYFGELFDKPYIGTNNRPLTTADMQTAIRINRTAEVIMVFMITVLMAIMTV